LTCNLRAPGTESTIEQRRERGASGGTWFDKRRWHTSFASRASSAARAILGQPPALSGWNILINVRYPRCTHSKSFAGVPKTAKPHWATLVKLSRLRETIRSASSAASSPLDNAAVVGPDGFSEWLSACNFVVDTTFAFGFGVSPEPTLVAFGSCPDGCEVGGGCAPCRLLTFPGAAVAVEDVRGSADLPELLAPAPEPD